MNQHIKEVVPFSLKDAPSLIERIFPSMKISAEAQKERKAVQGQMLTALGSYWKGRKPLFLTRACVLGCLLPATNRPDKDLHVFELLMAIDDEAFKHRVKKKSDFPDILKLSYDERVTRVSRVEDLAHDFHADAWPTVNAHLGTSATSIEMLVAQLGQMRFGRVPVIADTFSGSGSIPFEAARMGCDVYASDLNPIACMLTWGALNVIGADAAARTQIATEQKSIAAEVDSDITSLGVEHDSHGNRAKAFLYCLETRCPETGWMVPMLPTRLISRSRRVVVRLVPDHKTKTYQFDIITGASGSEMAAAETGTLHKGRLVHSMNPDSEGVAISTIRGDYKDSTGQRLNKLRKWNREDFVPREDDVLQERLYCIQWTKKETLTKTRQETFFAAPTKEDLQRESSVLSLVWGNLSRWQEQGLIPDMLIEPGDKTDEPIRTRGWTHWHHLFSPRQLLNGALILESARKTSSAFYALDLGRWLDNNCKLCSWTPSSVDKNGKALNADRISHVFYNQALNTMASYAVRSSVYQNTEAYRSARMPGRFKIANHRAGDVRAVSDVFVTDPPYADAVNYHEITEFFIAWLRKSPPKEFADWNWDSRRRLAIKGKGEEFRASMVEAYKAMADHMPDNGIQIVMFTHQDGKVWSDMAQIFWGAGLQVMADWYIATETTSELKKGGYVQGTHIIVLRKRAGNESGYADEITQEVKDEVARQIEEMTGLNQSLKGKGRSENLFNDADLQMAGYAAALRVLTKYVKIDGKDMTVEAMRPRAKNERTVIDDIIEYAVQVANEHLVPEGMDEHTWRRLTGTERFYLKMMDIETTGAKKVDNYQNFAKAFRVPDYGALMSSVSANSAALKSATDFGKRQMGDDEFGTSITRIILYALWEMANGADDDIVVVHVRDMVTNYLDRRADIVAVANYIGAKRKDVDREESQNAGVLAGLIKNERLG